jgi:DNA-binding response OmpR family regulator
MKCRILLVEDDEMIASGLVYSLQSEGYGVVRAACAAEAVSAIDAQMFDLAVLDLQLPDGSGFDVWQRLRLKQKETAAIFLTVADDEGNTVRALEGGADDYITKPFRLRELLARIKTVLRRRGTGSDLLTFGRVMINIAAGTASIDGVQLELTALEYRLLLIFANNRGRILERGQILDNLWDSAGNFVEDNTLTVYVKRLREKLGAAASIETVRGVGYKAGA